MTCQSCVHWSPKKSGQMAKNGLAICLKGPRWTFYPPQHACAKHQLAAQGVVDARVVWLEKSGVAHAG